MMFWQWLSEMLHIHHSLAVLNYITLRCLLAAISAFFLVLVLGKRFIGWLQVHQLGQVVRDDGPETHLQKQGTPTMGGILIFVGILFAAFLWCDWANHAVQLSMLSLVLFAIVGGVDDWLKIRDRSSDGLSAATKFSLQVLVAGLVMALYYLHASTPAQTTLYLPLLKGVAFNLGAWVIPFGMLVIVASSNAVNLTDGLDGLVIMPVILVIAGLAVVAYCSGHASLAKYLHLPHLPGLSEAGVLFAAIIGAGLGFLWFNAYPAQIFMGDLGSLSLGAFLGVASVLVRQELMLVIMGFVFVLEAMSVILQVASFKLRGKRIFKMAPIHHHFELSGVPESKLIIRFWILTALLVLFCLATLKLR